jgi:hypothetical protein
MNLTQCVSDIWIMMCAYYIIIITKDVHVCQAISLDFEWIEVINCSELGLMKK